MGVALLWDFETVEFSLLRERETISIVSFSKTSVVMRMMAIEAMRLMMRIKVMHILST